MLTSQAAEVPSISDMRPTPPINISVSASARGSTVCNRCGHTFCSEPMANTTMVPRGSKMMPVSAAAKTVHAIVPGAGLTQGQDPTANPPHARQLGVQRGAVGGSLDVCIGASPKNGQARRPIFEPQLL